MKNALILHGSYSSPDKNWFQYVGKKVGEKGYKVAIPQLSSINELNIEETFQELFNKNLINRETVMIGHSSGATLILHFLQMLPAEIVIEKAILVSGFVDANLTEALLKEIPRSDFENLFSKSWNWEKIRKNSRKFIIIHAPDDPYVQMRHAEFLRDRLKGSLISIPGGGHFSTNTGGDRFKEFPELLPYIFG